jgi:hypothetical protein
MSTHYFVCRNHEPEPGQFFGDVVPIDEMKASTNDRRVAEKFALKKFLESKGVDPFYVLEAKIVFQPAIKNLVGEGGDIDITGSLSGSAQQKPMRSDAGAARK